MDFHCSRIDLLKHDERIMNANECHIFVINKDTPKVILLSMVTKEGEN